MVNRYDMYELHTGLSSKPTVEDRIIILDLLSTIINVIKFRVFYCKFRLAYVGSSWDEAQSTALIISEYTKSPNFIKINYKEPSSKRFITTLPDTVYLIMTAHTTLLPNDAVSWPFVLPCIFFNSLTTQLRKSMQQEVHVLSSPVGLLTKSEQINAITTRRDLSRVSYKGILDMVE